MRSAVKPSSKPSKKKAGMCNSCFLFLVRKQRTNSSVRNDASERTMLTMITCDCSLGKLSLSNATSRSGMNK